MKKIYTTPEYRRKHKRRILKFSRPRYYKRRYIINHSSNVSNFDTLEGDVPILAPVDFRLLENTDDCLVFFREIRKVEGQKIRFIRISFKAVKQIDYATISVLTAIMGELGDKGKYFSGDFPSDENCRRFIIDSGFLNHMVDGKNRRFPKTEMSDMIAFEKGTRYLGNTDIRKIGELVKNVVKHLTGNIDHCKPVYSILLEICGNSLEHAASVNKQWLLGVKYEPNKVTFTVTDVGRGILDTLHRKFKLVLKDIFTGKRRHEILIGAFDKKYGSSTQEANRNKGLPSIKYIYENKYIFNLMVLTNDVLLHFNNINKTRTFPSGNARFKGTLYQWEMDKRCLEITNSEENVNTN